MREKWPRVFFISVVDVLTLAASVIIVGALGWITVHGAARSAQSTLAGGTVAVGDPAMFLGGGAHSSIGVQGVYIIGGVNGAARHITLVAVHIGSGISDTRRVIVRRGAALNYDISYIVGAYRHPTKSELVVLPIETWSKDMPFAVSLQAAPQAGEHSSHEEIVIVPRIRPMDLVIVPWSDLE